VSARSGYFALTSPANSRTGNGGAGGATLPGEASRRKRPKKTNAVLHVT